MSEWRNEVGPEITALIEWLAYARAACAVRCEGNEVRVRIDLPVRIVMRRTDDMGLCDGDFDDNVDLLYVNEGDLEEGALAVLQVRDEQGEWANTQHVLYRDEIDYDEDMSEGGGDDE